MGDGQSLASPPALPTPVPFSKALLIWKDAKGTSLPQAHARPTSPLSRGVWGVAQPHRLPAVTDPGGTSLTPPNLSVCICTMGTGILHPRGVERVKQDIKPYLAHSVPVGSLPATTHPCGSLSPQLAQRLIPGHTGLRPLQWLFPGLQSSSPPPPPTPAWPAHAAALQISVPRPPSQARPL